MVWILLYYYSAWCMYMHFTSCIPKLSLHFIIMSSLAFRVQIEAPLLSFNATELISELETLRANPAVAGMPSMVMQIDSITMNLRTLQDDTIPDIITEVVCL